MYLLGMQDSNKAVSIDDFLNQYGSIRSETLRAIGDVNVDDRGNRGNSNVIVYLDFGLPTHVALYLGKINGIHYEFGQWKKGKPRFAQIDSNQELMFYRMEPVG